MIPFPKTWNEPSPYSYAPPPSYFTLLESNSKIASNLKDNRYVPTNPHNLPEYPYFQSHEKAAPSRSPAARDGKWDPPIRPGASPIWHPPPPPHDDIFRINRSPNLHDGFDLKTGDGYVLPPCCDFCMSTYFPHIINDEWQLPQRIPYDIANVAFLQTESKPQKSKPKKNNTKNNNTPKSGVSKSDPKKCCHKCVRKNLEDTDWQIYAIPEPTHSRF